MGSQASQEDETGYEFDGDARPVIEKGGSRAITSSNPPPMVISKLKYQVWSTVLGSSLSTIKPNWDKIETKVYAGGTHIATQIADGGDQMLFHTADPVTGTVGKFAGSGSSTDKEESEPMGQKIGTTDPGTSYPTVYPDVHGVAKDPEWQCLIEEQFFGGLRGSPIHCQKKAALDPKYHIVVSFGKHDSEKSPAFVDSPILDFETDFSPFEDSLAYARASTAKQDQEKPKKKRKRRSSSKVVKKTEPLAVVQSQPANDLNVDPPDFSGDIWDALGQGIRLINLFQDKVKLVGFSEAQEEAIRISLFYSFLSVDCANAYRAAGIQTPAEVVRDRGVVIAHYELLRFADNNGKLGITEKERSRIISSEKLTGQGLDEIFGFSNPHNPSIPSRVTTIIGLDSPIDRGIPGVDSGNGNGNGSSLALAAMLSPTSKKDDKKPKPVPKINLPEEQVEIKIPAIDMSVIPDFQSAEMGDVPETVRPAIDAVREILTSKGADGKNPCADFLKGKGIEALDGGFTFSLRVAALKNDDGTFNYNTGIRGSYSFGESDVERGYIRPNEFVINEKGGFFNRQVFDLAKGRLVSTPRFHPNYENGSLGSQILQILHEIGHLVLVDSKGNTVLPADGVKKGERTQEQSVSLSEKNTDAVLDNCGAQIKAYIKGRKKK